MRRLKTPGLWLDSPFFSCRFGRAVLAALSLWAVLPPDDASAWWNSSWSARRTITFNNSGQPQNLDGFPVLIVLNSTRIDYARTQNLGQDLRFVDANDLTVLDHEIELWNEAGTSYVWVRVPRIDASSTSDFIYMYYGNAAAPDGQNPAGVWDADFKLVQHLNETAGAHTDSTSNANDSVVVDVQPPQGATAGQIDGADLFSAASTDNIDVANNASLNVGAAESFTVEAWVRTSTTGSFQHVVSKEVMAPGAGLDLTVWSTNLARFAVVNTAAAPPDAITEAVVVTDNNWHYLVGRWTRATATADLFVDGVGVDTATNVSLAGSPFSNASPFVIGEEGDASRGFNFDGRIDEVRFSKVVRSDNWIRAQNLSMRDAFVTFGAPLDFSPPGQMRMRSGTYTGDGAAGRPIFVGFQPDVVLVKADAAQYAVIRTSTMVGDNTKSLSNAPPAALSANRIQSLGSSGFTVGPSAQVNAGGTTYHWVAFKAAPGELVVGTYIGNGIDDTSITGMGFQPELVITLPVVGGPAGLPQMRSSTLPADTSYDFDTAATANAIQAVLGDGFQVGTQPFVNTNLATYHYIAWNAVPGRMAVGTYVGNGIDDRNLDIVGFHPEWLVLRRNDINGPWVHKPASTGVSTNYSLVFSSSAGGADDIQALRPLGFQVGFGPEPTNDRTNENLVTYHWIAFGPHLPTTNYRSIGTAAAYGTGTISVTNGSQTVTGAGGATWQSANRGRGDVITIPCNDPPACLNGAAPDGVHYTVSWVGSETSLQLTQGYAEATASGLTYLIRRQFFTLSAWEDCVDGPPGVACPFFPVASPDLVADDRREVGVAYKDTEFDLTADFFIADSTTDALHTITLTADGVNRHNGVPGAGVILDAQLGAFAIRIEDNYVTVEWLEHVRCRTSGGSIQVGSAAGGETGVVVQNMLVHDYDTSGIRLRGGGGKSLTVRNSMVWGGGSIGIEGDETTDALLIENCSVDGIPGSGINARSSALTVRNTIVTSSGISDFAVSAGSMNGSNNTSSDATAPGANPQTGVAAASIFVTPNFNLHLIPAANSQIDTGLDLSSSFTNDIDGTLRPGGLWDRGADEFGATTEVDLLSFVALGLDGAVELLWETASETNNLGFYLYRAESSGGPFALVTPTPIPGLGSSPVGARYRHFDHGVVNGRTYYYLLEDYETTGRTERHGPVSATPRAGAPSGDGSSEPPTGDTETSSRITYGDPNHTSLRILESSQQHLLVELTTGGFFAEPLTDGSVRLSIPDFVEENAPGSPAIPTRRAWLEAVAGRRVRVDSVRALDVAAFTSLRPLAAEVREVVASRSGALRVGKRRQAEGRLFRRKGLYPGQEVSLLETAFQGETKKVLLELAPLRWDPRSEQLLLAQRLLVRLVFTGREPDERPRGGARGRRYKERLSHHRRGVLARFGTGEKGLYSVRFEDLFQGRARRLDASRLRLSRRGSPVAFHVEPKTRGFGPGSALYFFSEGASLNPYGPEAVYELELGEEPGLRIPTASVSPHGASRASYLHRLEREENLFFAAQLNLPNFWPWASILASTTKSFPFEVLNLVPSAETARLELWLLGVTATPETVEHRVRLFLNGQLVAEPNWRSSSLERLTLDLSPTLLQEGENTLAIENANSFYSAVMLDRFAVSYPRLAAAEGGPLQGTFTLSGAAEVSGLALTPLVLDLTGSVPQWLTGVECALGVCRFRVESGGVYLAAQNALKPRVELASPGRLKSKAHQYDYLIVGPRAFLETAEPLLEHRRSQGLKGLAVAMEDVYDEFGFGESNPLALRDFLTYAFHQWSSPAPRYVLLLGDGTYDYKDHLKTGVRNEVPPLLFKSTYIWTASDSLYAAVNGEDSLPDLAIGRLPASTPEEARSMVDKILAFENTGLSLDGPAVLVSDNSDHAGNFEAQTEEIATTLLASRETARILLGQLGTDATRAAILDAFAQGPSLLSFVGHGSQQMWAHENILHASQIGSLSPQNQQPLVLTMNCLNGYFQYPYDDSLSEELVKAEGKGAIAAFSPSGLSLNDAAHLFHKAFLAELNQQDHQRLGDALLAAQAAYADTGASPEMIDIYHLFGDPALQIR